ncbi:hypothetical protein [Streptacidiphilus fuscans]|uniref:Uncharacterized protein n=1 Tax=Streptacidiphilus fuscans TaxID=2789292 RepID=A0A931B7C1_9ACTN|nr:hypothetical protein [Streptacidiphilus fuscans]MBF9072550.1 hypothetical protein [Streptacidiphilus fuscans]
MPTPAVVVTTSTSDVYHSRRDCKIFLAGQVTDGTNDGGVPDVVLVPLGEALAHRHPCPDCLR